MRQFLSILLLLISLIPSSCSVGGVKYVHLSVDDVFISMSELTKDSTSYSSIYEHPLFSFLQSLHKDYGCRFTLYCYERSGNYHIANFPHKFKKELADAHEWLKFGFHAVKPGQERYEISRLNAFSHSYTNTNKAIEEFSSVENIASILRLEYFYATPQECDFLYRNGTKMLLSADDSRVSYSGYKRNIIQTDVRIENISNLLFELWKSYGDDTLVVFTHERFLTSKKYKDRLRSLIHRLDKSGTIYMCQ